MAVEVLQTRLRLERERVSRLRTGEDSLLLRLKEQRKLLEKHERGVAELEAALAGTKLDLPPQVGDRVRIRQNASSAGGPLNDGPTSIYAGRVGQVVDPSEHPFSDRGDPLGGYDRIVRLDGDGTRRFNLHELERLGDV